MDTITASGSVGSRRPFLPFFARARGIRSVAICSVFAMLSACGNKGSHPDTNGWQSGNVAIEKMSEPNAPDLQNPDSLVEFYSEVEGELTASGRMRRETSPNDAPFGIDELVQNFERIALFDEYVDVGGQFVRGETPAFLRRWNRPVRVGIMNGHSVPASEAARDRANVAAFTSRLARLTGLDMKLHDDENVNFLVLFMNSSERVAFAEQVAEKYPEFAPAVMGAIRDSSVETFCTAYAFSDPGDRASYSAVMILIRAEHPPLTRLSCVHEEMAQAMGLPNDSPVARPSLFNDSLEFALLTSHDEILLQMLYDPRLKPGMTAQEAKPILPEVATDAYNAQMRRHNRSARIIKN